MSRRAPRVHASPAGPPNYFDEWQRVWAPAHDWQAEEKATTPSAEQLLEDIRAFFPDAGGFDAAAVQALVDEAVRDNDLNLGKEAGLKWADGFTWDPGRAAESDRVLTEVIQGDLAAMIRALQGEKAHERLSVEMIDATCSDDNPWKAKLKELVTGMPVEVDDEDSPRMEYVTPRAAT